MTPEPPTSSSRHDQDPDRTNLTPMSPQKPTPSRLQEGSRLGGFIIKRLIGSGGMGKVFEARQENPRRTVAIKVMSKGVTSRSALKRFEFEAQVLARLKHAGIAQIYEVGNWTDPESGEAVPWFAMEYISNAKPITEYARDHVLDTRARLKLFQKACEAVSHGHERGVIHRDLKPTNILVDGSGHVKVIDFGVARTTDSDMAATTMQTDVGQLIGTVQYMSPEQFDADPHDLDIRTDVNALGVVLYELLANRLPYSLRKLAIHEAARIVREEDPQRLSTDDSSLGGDLEVIVGKAMAKDRAKRYGNASGLAQDISHYLDGEAITARAPGVAETLRRFARRHRVVTSAILAAFGVLAIALVVVGRLAMDLERTNAAIASEQVKTEAALQEARSRGTEAEQARTRSDAALAHLTSESYVSAVRRGTAAMTDHRGDIVSHEVESIAGLNIAQVNRRLEMQLLLASLHPELLLIAAHDSPINAVAISPDGRTIATAGDDEVIRLWNSQSGTALAELKGHGSRVNTLAFSPDGRTLASGGDDNSIRLWDPLSQGGLPLGELKGHSAAVRSISFSPDGKSLASASADRSVRLWNVLSHGCTYTLNGHDKAVRSVSFSPSGLQLASASADKTVRVWDPANGSLLHTLDNHPDALTCVAFSADGGTLADGSTDGTLTLWNTLDWTQRAATPLGASIHGTAFAPRGAPSTSAALVVATSNGCIQADPSTGLALPQSQVDRMHATCLTFAPDGKSWANGSTDGALRIWDSTSDMTDETWKVSNSPVYAVACAPEPSGLVAVSGENGSIQLWDADASLRLAVLAGSGRGDAVQAIGFSPGGKRLACASRNGALSIWNSATGQLQHPLIASGNPLFAVAFSPDGRTLATAGEDRLVQFWDVESQKVFAQFKGHTASVYALCFSPSGRVLASADADGIVRMWDLDTRQELGLLSGHQGPVHALAFAADGKTIATASYDRTLRVWDVTSRKQSALCQGHESEVESVAFDLSGQTIASGSRDGSVRLWNAQSGKELAVLTLGIGTVQSISMSHNGNLLACGGSSGVVKLIRAEPKSTFVTRRTATLHGIATLQNKVAGWLAESGQAGALEKLNAERSGMSPTDALAIRDLIVQLGSSASPSPTR